MIANPDRHQRLRDHDARHAGRLHAFLRSRLQISSPLSALAREIWVQHYPGIITVKQIEYMLGQRYSPDAIRARWRAVTAWWDKLRGGWRHSGGFATYERGTTSAPVKLDKLYVHQLVRGRAMARPWSSTSRNAARRQGMDTLTLGQQDNYDSVAAYTGAWASQWRRR